MPNRITRSPSVQRTVLLGSIGNVLEWYDFAIYGFLAPIVGKLFFPSDDAFASVLSAFGVLAVGYAARPRGSVVFGYIGDRAGRKPALVLSVILMGVATCAIGLLPTYSRIGEAAPPFSPSVDSRKARGSPYFERSRP